MARRSSDSDTLVLQKELSLSPLTIKRGAGKELVPGPRPFLKWAGGKTQLLSQFEQYFPKELKEGKITKYFEPFLGGGAVFFHVFNFYGANFKQIYLSDYNSELILVYRTLQSDVLKVIESLKTLAEKFGKLEPTEQAEFFYEIRHRYNEKAGIAHDHPSKKVRAERTAQAIFLNRTCFNGLFRVNAQGKFNVPFGRYKNPRILDTDNLLAVSKALKSAQIECGDFQAMKNLPDKHSFVYFDPPYRPLSATSSFTAYSKAEFGDDEQVRLAELFAHLALNNGAKVMLSNSDPKNTNPRDNFFDDLYGNKQFQIRRVSANRMINSRADKRGCIKEILVTSYRRG